MVFSEFESKVFGLNVYRDDGRFFATTENKLEDFISLQKAAIIRFSIECNAQETIDTLFAQHHPIFFAGTIINYKLKCSQKKIFSSIYNCTLRDIEPEDNKFLSGIIHRTFINSPLYYNKIKLLRSKIKSEQETTAIEQYIFSLVGSSKAGIKLLIDNSIREIVGFTTYEICKDNVYHAYAAIDKPFWNSKYYEQLILDMLSLNENNGYEYISFGAKASNYTLINKYNRIGATVENMNHVFNLVVPENI